MSTFSAPLAASKQHCHISAFGIRRSPYAAIASHGQAVTRRQRLQAARSKAASHGAGTSESQSATSSSRRELLFSATIATSMTALGIVQPATAVQGITAGRLPGVSKEADSQGYFTYQRPEGKSGGHGVGWTEIPRYSFKVPPGWEETPVSIADLGGTEIDLRYGNRKEGGLVVIVAPVMRFKDIGFNADVTLEDIGPPDRLILGFAPEIVGSPLPEDAVEETQVVKKDGRTYYQWRVSLTGSPQPYRLVTATAVGNRAFLLGVTASGRQWRAAQEKLRMIQESFFVPEVNV